MCTPAGVIDEGSSLAGVEVTTRMDCVSVNCGILDMESKSVIVGSGISKVVVDCVHSHVELVSAQNLLQTLMSRMA